MGLMEALFGKKKAQEPKIDGLFKLAPASVTMESLGLSPTGKAGICFKPFDSKEFEAARDDFIKILDKSDFRNRYRVLKDDHGFTWVALESSSLADSAANIYMVGQLLDDAGYGQHILCAVFRFDKNGRPIYWIYNYRRGTFYPFAPVKENERDTQLEYRLRLEVNDELPVDSLDYWFPIWGIPF